jgi:hypothetical protein
MLVVKNFFSPLALFPRWGREDERKELLANDRGLRISSHDKS